MNLVIRRYSVCIIVIGLWCGSFGIPVQGESALRELIVADFNSAQKQNNLKGAFGTWDFDPADHTQGCHMSFIKNDDAAADFHLQLDYDVESEHPAFNGLWMKLNALSLEPFNHMRFRVRGVKRFTSEFKVELTTMSGKRAVYIIKGVNDTWQEVMIDIKKTDAIKDWTALSELTVVFSDVMATVKEGTILIDDIAFLTV